MSDKKRRDITLGEMQDECLRQRGYCDFCDVKLVCTTHLHRAPDQIDLSNPPRFNEAQMAALKKSYESGVLSMTRYDGMMCYQTNDFMIALTDNGIAEMMQIGETLDLADLLGKDGAE